MQISQDLRSLALIITLLRAGLGLRRDNLTKVGHAAVRMSFVACVLEGLTVMVLAQRLLGLGLAEAGMLGFILAAVSPAVVVPGMLNLRELGYGEDKQVGTLVLAGASVDDVLAITLFSSFLGLGIYGQTNLLMQLGRVPLAVGSGVLAGALLALLLLRVYRWGRLQTRNTEKLVLLVEGMGLCPGGFIHVGWG